MYGERGREGGERRAVDTTTPLERVWATRREAGGGRVCEGHRKEVTAARGTQSFRFFQEKEVPLGDIARFAIFVLKTDYTPNPINHPNTAPRAARCDRGL